MIEQLTKNLSDFSKVNCTWCFLHIVNLCTKSIIRQFDVQKKDTDEPVDDTEHELQDLTEEINLEEQQVAKLLQQHASDGEVKMMMMILMGGWMRWPCFCLSNGQNYMKRFGL